VVLAFFAVALLTAGTRAAAQTEKVLYNFNAPVTPFNGPAAGLVSDAPGNLYGTTQSAGIYRGGTVFELMPKAGGGWTEKTLHNFGNGADGAYVSASLILDAAGNLYGTTYDGGGTVGGYGTVFELKPKAGGGWSEKVLCSFDKYEGHPTAGLIVDAAGNIYGTTAGYIAYGIVFELTPHADGTWTETTLHAFNYDGTDGIGPRGPLIFDGHGNLFGTTYAGGSFDCGAGCGTVFELSPSAGGVWTETILHRFHNNGSDGVFPAAGLILDASGNLYGTTTKGGTGVCTNQSYAGCGIVFELSPTSGGWTGKILYDFNGTDGYQPTGLTMDAAGHLYGTTAQGGTGSCTSIGLVGCGTVFKLTHQADGIWTEKVLHNFAEGKDGIEPLGGVILDKSGNLYGTTYHGGTYGGTYDYDGGTVFKVTP
jgi:uncharacterized repeat protein (TIGR03803 family)